MSGHCPVLSVAWESYMRVFGLHLVLDNMVDPWNSQGHASVMHVILTRHMICAEENNKNDYVDEVHRDHNGEFALCIDGYTI